MATALLIVIYIIFISLGLPDSILGSSFPAIAENLSLSSDLAGYISLIVSACTILSSLLSPYLVKKMGAKWVIAVSILLTAVGLLCFSFVSEEVASWAFYVIALPLGLGAGAIDATLNNYVALHYKAIHMNWLHCCWGIGASVSPMILGAFIDSENNSAGWSTGVLVVSIIQFCILLTVFLTLPLWNKAEKQRQAQELKEHREEEVVCDDPHPTRSLLKMPVFWMTLVGFMCYCGIETTTGLWVGTYFNQGHGLSTEQSAMLTSTFYIGITIGRFISGPLSLKIKENTMIRIGETLLVLALILIFMAPLSIYLPMVGFVMFGLGCAPIYPAVIRLTPYRFSKKYSQNATSIEMAGAYVGSLAVPPLYGLICENIGNYSILPYVLAVLCVILILMNEIINVYLKKRDSKLTDEEKRQYETV